MIGEEYISTKEAAERLEVSRGWVAALCRTGVLRAKGGGRGAAYRIERSSVDQLAAARAQPPTHEDIEAVAREIEEDDELREAASQRAEESFRERVLRIAERVLTIAKKYGPGMSLIVAGVASAALPPPYNIIVAPVLIAEGLRRLP